MLSSIKGPKTRFFGKKATAEDNKESLKTIALAILLAHTFRSLAYEPFHIPSGSMKPTLLVGDYIWVSKYSYGYSRYSFPFGFPLFEGRLFAALPERGDVAVFRPPSRPHTDFIKRVIGLPGDKIQMIEGRLHINGAAVEIAPIKHFLDKYPDGSARLVPQAEETLPGGMIHRVIDADPQGMLDNTDIYTVPEGHVFMMGDNRDESVDSRVLEQVGFIPVENLIGRAEVMFFSTDGTARVWQVWKWFSALRPERMFESIR